MGIIQRSFVDEADLSAMAKLANEFAGENMHVADLPYRFSSWAMDYPENIGLWFDGNENIVGWAVMQTPFWTIDYAVHPRATPWVRNVLTGSPEGAQPGFHP